MPDSTPNSFSKRAADAKMIYVPYSGTSPATTALLGEHGTAMIAEHPAVAEQLNSAILIYNFAAHHPSTRRAAYVLRSGHAAKKTVSVPDDATFAPR
jgi:hypothetical protein